MLRNLFSALVLFSLPAAAQECRLVSLSPLGEPHYFYLANRIRRIDAGGRAVTRARNGLAADQVTEGPAHETGLPNVAQIAFFPQAGLFFTATGRAHRGRVPGHGGGVDPSSGAPPRISGVYRLRGRVPAELEAGEHLVVVEMDGQPGPFPQQVTLRVQ